MLIKVEIVDEDVIAEYSLNSDIPISFSEIMRQLGLVFHKPCGGNLRCFRCGVQFLYGAPDISDADTEAYSGVDLKNGWRLGCNVLVDHDCKLQVSKSLVGDIKSCDTKKESTINKNLGELAVAVDIGTTTVICAVVDTKNNKVLTKHSYTNPQVSYGADVMTRIQHACQGRLEELSNLIKDFLVKIINELLSGCDFKGQWHVPVIISANTTMLHLLNEFPVVGLAAYPFSPYCLAPVDKYDAGLEISFLPSVSAFVGGDIVSGLYYLREDFTAGKNIFVDLGTNAEIVIFDGKNYLCGSAACGPALEGGNLSCGIASVEGAINHIVIESNHRCIYETIEGAAPVGICGSGIIDLMAQLRLRGIIDEGGLLIQPYQANGFPVTENIKITGEDIQQVILAKSAIYSTIEILMNKAGISANDISHVYVAGGLGKSLKSESISAIKLLPKELCNKIISVGNSSLFGAIRFLNEHDENAISQIVAKTKVLEMSMQTDFQEKFLENLHL